MSTWITGYFGHENLGDEAILAAVLTNTELKSDAKVLTWNIQSVQAIHHNIACIKPPPVGKNRLRYSITQGYKLLPDLIAPGPVIIAGGGSLNDHVPNRIVNRLKEVKQFKALRRRVGLLAMGANQLVLAEDKKALKTLIEKEVSYCSVRDDESLRALTASGIDVKNVKKTTDLVFSLDQANNKKSYSHDNLKKAKVALNFRPLFDNNSERGEQKTEKYETYVARCLQIINDLKRQVGELELLPLCPEDKAFLESLAVQTKVKVVASEINPYQAISRLKEYDLLVGMRYHAVIFSLLAGLVTVPISYSPKVYSVNQLFSLGGDELIVGDGSEMPDQMLDSDTLLAVVEQSWLQKKTQLTKNAALCAEQCAIAKQDIENCWRELQK